MPALTIGELMSLLRVDEFVEICGDSMTAKMFTTWDDGSISLMDVIELEN